jgi:radical SAM-linked protein
MAVKPKNGAPPRIRKRVVAPFALEHFPEDIIVPNIQVVFDRVSVEAERGCPQSCRFCQATHLYFPSRAKNPAHVAQSVLKNAQTTGYEDASLSALSIGDYPYLDQTVRALMDEFQDRQISLSVSSLRPKGLSSDLAENILRVRKTGFTLVPEAGTERLRRVINKSLDDKDIWEAVQNAFTRGWRLLKLYFMVGLPSEKDEDLDGIIHLVKEIIRMGHRILKKPPQINLSISSFIPKPHTPFQWEKMEDEDILFAKLAYVKSRLKKYSFVKFKDHNLKNALLEAVFSRGDRRLTPALIHAWQAGARFDSWGDLFQYRYWEDAFKAENIDPSRYHGSLNESDLLPWDHIDTGIKKSHLAGERHRAQKELSSPRCLERSCADCQGCSLASLLVTDRVESLDLPEYSFPIFGIKSETGSRYLAFYSKEKEAKYFSHADTNNIIQRGFRRAGIPISFTEGFHPKMILSYPPALPLGMEGKAEVVEFRSGYDLPRDEFAAHLNRFLPSGVSFSGLEGIEWNAPSLVDRIHSIIYSMNLNSEQVIETFKGFRVNSKDTSLDISDDIEERVCLYRKDHEYGPMMVQITVDRNTQKILLDVRFDPKKIIRPQDIVSDILGISNPVYDMARERIVFKTSRKIN